MFHKHLLGNSVISGNEMSKYQRLDSCGLSDFTGLFHGQRIVRNTFEKISRSILVKCACLYGSFEHLTYPRKILRLAHEYVGAFGEIDKSVGLSGIA